MNILSDGQLGQGLRQLQMVLQVCENQKTYTKYLKEMGQKLDALEKANAQYTETRLKVDGADARQAAKEQSLKKMSERLDGREAALGTREADLKKRSDKLESEKVALAEARQADARRIENQDHTAAVREKGLDVLAKRLAEREKAISEREATLKTLIADNEATRQRFLKAAKKG